MDDELDEKLGRLLRADAIPERDALFRIRLLERGERQRYRQRARLLWILAAAIAIVPAGAYALFTRLPAPRLLEAALIAAFGLAFIAAALFSFRGVLQAMRWLRRN